MNIQIQIRRILAAVLVLSAAVAAAEPVVDVPGIAGKTAAEVAGILGPATACEPSKYGETCAYLKGDTEVVFIDGRADWITVQELPGVPYGEDALGALGLEPKAPTVRGADSMFWRSIPGLIDVSLFRGDRGSIFYAYVKVKTR